MDIDKKELNEAEINNPGPFPAGEQAAGKVTEHFTGKVYLAPLINNDECGIVNVTFEPGCYNKFHIHHGHGQMLICVGGRGWYQEEGQPACALKAGDVVDIRPEVKHWHGAAKDSWFSHISVGVRGEGGGSTWCDFLPEDEYNNL